MGDTRSELDLVLIRLLRLYLEGFLTLQYEIRMALILRPVADRLPSWVGQINRFYHLLAQYALEHDRLALRNVMRKGEEQLNQK